MKSLCLTLALVIYMSNPLASYKWKNRIILLFGTDKELVKDQLVLLENENDSLEERDLILFDLSSFVDTKTLPFSTDQIKTLSQKYLGDDKSFQLVLIGKDGGRKLVSEQPVKPFNLYALIDGMPMRRQEMKKGN